MSPNNNQPIIRWGHFKQIFYTNFALPYINFIIINNVDHEIKFVVLINIKLVQKIRHISDFHSFRINFNSTICN